MHAPFKINACFIVFCAIMFVVMVTVSCAVLCCQLTELPVTVLASGNHDRLTHYIHSWFYTNDDRSISSSPLSHPQPRIPRGLHQCRD